MDRPIKAHLSNRSNRSVNRPVAQELLNLDLNSNRSNPPVNRSNRPVNRSEPVARELLNLFEFEFEFNRFRSNRSGKPLPEGGGLTGPVGFFNPAPDVPC